jgi:predicted RNA polymerase sigma factor
MVQLNYAIAAAMVHGATKGRNCWMYLGDSCRESLPAGCCAGAPIERAGGREGAIKHYRLAAARPSLPERNYLLKQAAKLILAHKIT